MQGCIPQVFSLNSFAVHLKLQALKYLSMNRAADFILACWLILFTN